MEPCFGATCEHGDTATDDTNCGLKYTGDMCRCTRCVNFDVCETWTPSDSGLCLACKSTFGKKLAPSKIDECVVCMEEEVLYRHPAGCGHVFCGACLQGVFTARPDHPDPREYGLRRSCGCDDEPAPWGTNECDSCAEAVAAFEATPAGQAWAEACMETETTANRCCPLCRKGI